MNKLGFSLIIAVSVLFIFILFVRFDDILLGIFTGVLVAIAVNYYKKNDSSIDNKKINESLSEYLEKSKELVTGKGEYEKDAKNIKRKLGNKTEKQLLPAINSTKFAGFKLNQKPEWLYTKDKLSGKRINLELDLYNPHLNVAIEYNGPQHYSKDYWDSDYEFIKYIQNDIIKQKVCAENGVNLIIIPYTVPHEKLLNYVKSRLMDIQEIREKLAISEDDYKKFKNGSKYVNYKEPPKIKNIEKIKKIVVSRDLHTYFSN